MATFNEIKSRGWVLFAVCIVAFMVQIDFTAVNVALETISKTVHSDLTTTQWVLSAYVLAWGAMVIPAGRLADLYGKRRMFIFGTFIFIVGSTLSGLSNTTWLLISSRVLQGIGGAIFLPAVYTLVFSTYPSNQRGKAMGILTMAFAFGMAIGPTLGGAILHWLNWRFIFFINVPLGTLVIFLTFWAVPKEPKKLVNEPMNYFGSIIFAATFILLMFAVDQVKNLGLTNPITLSIFLASFVLLALTLIIQTKTKYPILKFSLFKNTAFLGCLLSYALLGYNFAAILIIGGLYLQSPMGYSAFSTGLIFLSMTIGFGLLSTYAGRLCDYVDYRLPIALGGFTSALGTIIFMSLTTTSPLWLICLMFFLAGTGFGFAFPGLNLAMMTVVNEDELNIASGTFTLFGCLGNTIGLIMSAVSIVYFGQYKLLSLIHYTKLSLNTIQENQLKALMASTHYTQSVIESLVGVKHVPTVIHNLHQAFVSAMTKSLLIALILAIISILLGIFLIKIPRN